ncbi:hypothetical protein G7Y89_g1282 [Cudoniella acicularis]|uniref:Uncharacterized protein n=1 Tax=Cudoniella acicularis TaxID=354080 RepID=A0A8H4RVK4_9HELO|nr:hypothetical protein G7Y89_g1282 [Cudoniella acicularis]
MPEPRAASKAAPPSEIRGPPTTAASARPLSKQSPAPVKLSAHFSKSQLALALAIQKSKPEGISTLEYYQQLRKRIRNGRNVPDAERRYIDTPEFWRDQYTKVHLEKKALEDKVLRLEEERRLLKEGIGREDSQGDDSHPLTVRQPLGGPQDYDKSTSNSRKRLAPHGDRAQFEEQERPELRFKLLSEDNILRISSYVLQLGRQRIKLEKTTKEIEMDSLDEATKSTLETLHVVECAISDCCLPLFLLKTNHGDHQMHTLLLQLMQQFSLCFRSCFNVMNQICRTIPGRARKNDIIYQMVTFFNKVLNELQSMSKQQAEHEEQARRRLRHKRPKVEEQEYAVNKYISAALCSIVSNLEWGVGKPGHRDLLEGILFCILGHAGRLLSCAIFEEHVAKSKKPGNVTENNPLVGPETARFEARYIVQILYAAMGGSDKKSLVTEVLAFERGDAEPLRQLRNPPKCRSLVDKAKMVVQSTLVKSALGGEEFESLKLPAPPMEGNIFLEADVVGAEAYGSEWFVDIVWAIVGWDMVG